LIATVFHDAYTSVLYEQALWQMARGQIEMKGRQYGNDHFVEGEERRAALRAVQLQMLKAKATADEDEDRLLVAKSQQDKDRILKTKKGKKSVERNSPKDYSHPYYWASFIQSGEWANLDGKR
jgi:hypothetical protein